jgi:hypothetical protein
MVLTDAHTEGTCRTREETEEFCKHVLVAKMASTAPNAYKAVQSIDLAPGVVSPRSSMVRCAPACRRVACCACACACGN